ncbi:MAG: 2-amino-4-hydroxy-6-hydroxymethyldihydropteridine diphosphokinase [Acidiferrobacteraceae bacterium]
MRAVFVGLGSNLGDPLDELRTACAELSQVRATTLDACSAVYRTAPLGVMPQPDFLNACCRLTTDLDPLAFLDELMRIEQRHGRTRPGEGAPRVLDLDLLLYDDLRRDGAALTLPHPRMHERAFVLRPLADLDATLVIPGRGPVRALLKECAGQRIQRLAEDLFHVPARHAGPGQRARRG